MEGIEWPNPGKIRTLGEKKTYKLFGIFEADILNKRIWKKKNLWRARKLLEIKLHSRNLIKGINTWVVRRVEYSGSLLKWTREEIQQIDQRTRKFMMMHKVLHFRNDLECRCQKKKKKKRRWGLDSIENCVDTSIQRPEDYIKNVRRKTDYSD